MGHPESYLRLPDGCTALPGSCIGLAESYLRRPGGCTGRAESYRRRPDGWRGEPERPVRAFSSPVGGCRGLASVGGDEAVENEQLFYQSGPCAMAIGAHFFADGFAFLSDGHGGRRRGRGASLYINTQHYENILGNHL